MEPRKSNVVSCAEGGSGKRALAGCDGRYCDVGAAWPTATFNRGWILVSCLACEIYAVGVLCYDDVTLASSLCSRVVEEEEEEFVGRGSSREEVGSREI